MTYKQVKSLKEEDFKRLCTVLKRDLNQMLEVVRSGDRHKRLYWATCKTQLGRPIINDIQ
ncbi:MAG: hypothetical protein V7L29_31040 [Nostoc sp.]|uniref:hypothetical protein n=1 Tax=Nostoc sp. TaxID=1180 RepID=UPI002FF265F9